MELLLHSPGSDGELSRHYRQAFRNAVELFIVTAYLTEWDASLELNSDCRSFRVIIGKDFGITRKAACETVMRWLPSKRKGQFLVADRIDGFHPKAVFWKERNRRYFAIVGSSNLTRAAFETNYEANVFFALSEADYVAGKRWVRQIEKQSVVVSEDWLKVYREASLPRWGMTKRSTHPKQSAVPLVSFKLPKPRGMRKQLDARRDQIAIYERNRDNLMQILRQCATGRISSEQFYDQLPRYWSLEIGDRLQGRGWERQGKGSDFQALSQSFLRILQAKEEDRDDVVVEEIDKLAERRIATRKSFLSEMLCLRFPDEYPVLNQPVRDYLTKIKFEPPQGASEGVRFVDLARKLRFSLLQNPDYSAKNLAELDAIIWLAHRPKTAADSA